MKKDKLLDKAQKLVQKGYIDKAVVEYAAIVQMDPADITIRLRLGDLYVKLAKNEEAIKEYTEVAKVHTNKGFYLKAIAVFKQILKLEDTLEIHSKLAELYTKQRLLADAVTEYGFIVAAYEKKNRTNDAFAMLKKMVEIAPDNMGVRIKLAEMHLKLGFDKDAMVEYKVIVDKLLAENKADKAERIFVEIYKSRRKEPMVLVGLYEIFKKKNDQEKALRFAREYFDFCRETGNEEEAKKACTWILAINPGDKEAKAFTAEPLAAATAPAPGKVEPLISFPDLGGMAPPPQAKAPEAPLIDINLEPAAPPKPVVQPKPAAAPPKPAAPPIKEEAPLIDIKLDVPTAPVKAVEEVQEVEELEEVESLEPLDVEPMEVETQEFAPEPSGAEAGALDFAPEPESGEQAQAAEQPSDGLVDLSKELGIDDFMDKMSVPWEDTGGSGSTEEFKEGMGEQLGKEDLETHYNLGIAYMEMELFDDAVREFSLASKSSKYALDCHIRLGHCFVPTGRIDEAVEHYNHALNIPGISEMDKMGIMYDLGMAFEAGDKKAEAIEMFRSVEAMDPNYREVKEKIRELIEGKSAATDESDELIEVEPL